MSRAVGQQALAAVATVTAVEGDCYQQTKRGLRELVARLGADGELRLPSEAELSAAFGVSRATLRSALLSLQKEGRIRRLHGNGTFVNRHALDISANLAEAGAFVDLLAAAGFDPDVRVTSRRAVPLDADVAAKLEVPAGEHALRVERVFTADGDPAVHSVDHFPLRHFDLDPATADPGQSTFEFVERHLGPPICYSVAEVRPVLPPPPVARALGVGRTHPLLRLTHTHVRADEQAVAVTVAHVNDDYLTFSVIRTYLDQ
jgi:GntR family transcriptional regulator